MSALFYESIIVLIFKGNEEVGLQCPESDPTLKYLRYYTPKR